ncbi:DNA topoisomerase I [Marinobacter lutaoensis]|uniref:DNA topoisomerase 1 n=1 Tax=Marinobacter lutaoensis TaxID=135739 RepID=A0A1V2DQD2_9GAMM|nr:type I DNA topoisomerase [Marinobacter lutaoensis]ONF42601.1 DNA topoisomerase I [Marinobacter lutaoensis]
MGQTLVIVESPAKAKKIQEILGPSYRVAASVGHMRDLPVKELGVDLVTLRPSYEISPGKQDVVTNLKRLAKQSDEVVLATDPDREGEAIAWHLQKTLNLPDTVKRVSYHEITAPAIKKALANPGRINLHLVAAQEARRVLDRLIGYQVSPALSQKANVNLSAGRVQSVAVRFVVDREREIKNFTPRDYFVCNLRLAGHPQFTATLDQRPFLKEGERLWLASDAKPFLGPQKVKLVKAEVKPSAVKPKPPFTTVELQNAAGKIFGFSAKEVMSLAQSLFEQGAITYHRTDSPNLSEEGIQKIQAYLRQNQLPVADKVATFKGKSDAQEAHEAIRPTHIEQEALGQTDAEKSLYRLIRERAMLSVMPNGVDSVTEYVFVSERTIPDVESKPRHPQYHTKGKVVQEEGWRAYATLEKPSTKDNPLPKLDKGAIFDGSVTESQKTTEPPPRYNEQSLIKAMEAKGIGRPSTYATIMENIKGRGYIQPLAESRAKSPNFVPGKHGYYIVDALREFSFLSYTYTRAIEASLDKISQGKMSYMNLVKPVQDQLLDDIENRLVAESLALTGRCPGCQKPVIQKFRASKGKGSKSPSAYWVHRDPHDADGCVQYLNDDKDAPVLPPPEVTSPCPNCNELLVRRYSRSKDKGPYWAHKNREHATSCGITFFPDNDGSPGMPEPKVTAKCEGCGGTVKLVKNRKTGQPLWVHEARSPKCGSKFLDDLDGKPAPPSPKRTARKRAS